MRHFLPSGIIKSMAKSTASNLFSAFLVVFLVGAIGVFFTIPAISTWYAALAKPAFNPPDWIFVPVWTTLYVLMALSFFLVLKNDLPELSASRKKGIAVFFVQLVLNAVWSTIFFGLKNPGWAFAEIILLWLAIVAVLAIFSKISKPAAWLLAPYIVWVSFAGYLNYSIWQFNFLASLGPGACTLEAKLCSDGSYVGRNGPDCLFNVCPKEDLIVVSSPRAFEKISSPLEIKGKARGPWFFEAIFPVTLLDEGGNVIARHYVEARGEWMSDQFVDFESTLEFGKVVSDKGTLIFEKSNASGLPEHDDEIRVPIFFK